MKSSVLALLILSATTSLHAQVQTGLGGEVTTLAPSTYPATPYVSAAIARNQSESPNRFFGDFYTLNSGYTTNLQLVDDPAGAARKVFKLDLKYDDPATAGAQRTEVTPNYEYVHEGKRWYAASLFIPGAWQDDTRPDHPVVVFQLHSAQGVVATSPPAAIVIDGPDLALETHTNYLGPGQATKTNMTTQRIALGPLAPHKGKWMCFVVSADWQSNVGVGNFTMWMDGVQVYQTANLYNSYQNTLGNYPKVGIYQPGVMDNTNGVRELYADFIFIGAADSTFEMMAAKTPCGLPQ